MLISADGKVMTAADVVHSMDEIAVEFLGGETMPARVVSSEPAAERASHRSNSAGAVGRRECIARRSNQGHERADGSR